MPSNFEAVALPETPAEGDETAARFEESVQLWKDIVGLSKTTAEARFFLRCGGGDVGRAVNVYFEDPNRFTRQPRLSKKDTDSEGGGAGGGGVLWRKKSWRVSSSNNGASRSSSTDTNTNRNDSLNGYLNDSGDYDPSDDEDTISTSAPLLSRFPSNLTMATGATSSTGGRSDGSVGFTTPDTPSTSESLPDEDLLGLAKGFFRLNQVLAMCCFLDQKVLRARDVQPLRDHLFTTAGIAVSSKRLLKVITDNKDEVIAASRWTPDRQVDTDATHVELGNEGRTRSVSRDIQRRRLSSDSSTNGDLEDVTEVSEAAPGSTTERTHGDYSGPSQALIFLPLQRDNTNESVDSTSTGYGVGRSFRKYSAEYWAALPSVVLSPTLQEVTHLTAEDLRVVMAFLQIGNLSNEDGSVRRYSDLELLSPRIGKSLEECRDHVTKYVKAVVQLLLNHDELLVEGARARVGSEASVRHASSPGSGSAQSFCLSKPPTPMRNIHAPSPGGPLSIDYEFEEEYLLMKSLKALLGNTTWNINGADAATFDWVNEQALKKLTAIARDGERYLYPRFRGAFATGIKVPPPRVHRLDDPGMIPFDTALKRQLTSNVGGLPPHESEFLVILEYLAQLVDPFFQRETRDLSSSCDGAWKGAPPKTCTRMAAKLDHDHREADEPKAAANLDMVRCALTFGTPEDLQNCYTLCDGGGTGVMTLLRAKNNFRESYNATRDSFGYRSILANYRLELPHLKWGDLFDADKQREPAEADAGAGIVGTAMVGEASPQSPGGGIQEFLPQFFRIGQVVVVEANLTSMRKQKTAEVAGFDRKGRVLLKYPGSRNDRGHISSGGKCKKLRRPGPPFLSVSDLIVLNRAACTAALQRWRVPQSLRHLHNLEQLVTRLQSSIFCNGRLRAAPVRFIVEIQFLLREYLRMRKRSHVWYKLQRTETLAATVSDFYSYAGIRRGTSFLLEALKVNDETTITHFARFAQYPGGSEQFAAQVRGCRDASTGYSVLHFIASQRDGRYDNLLEPVLAIEGLDVNLMSVHGETAHAVAKSSGNLRAKKLIAAHSGYNVAWEALPSVFANSCGGNWKRQWGWLTGTPLDKWFGITVDSRDRITGIGLQANGVHGRLDAITTGLSAMSLTLTHLLLQDNHLHGRIPDELCRLVHLERLEMDNNKLTGQIPSSIGALAQLRHLGLSCNQLTGQIPLEAVATLTSLRNFRVIKNLRLTNIARARSFLKKSLPNCNLEI